MYFSCIIPPLADSLANITEDSGWLLTGSVAYRKVGNTVYVVRGGAVTIAANTETTIATLPVGYRPTVYPFHVGLNKTSYINVTLDGKVNAYVEGANYIPPFYCSYLVI